jgi:hypothetical protein
VFIRVFLTFDLLVAAQPRRVFRDSFAEFKIFGPSSSRKTRSLVAERLQIAPSWCGHTFGPLAGTRLANFAA